MTDKEMLENIHNKLDCLFLETLHSDGPTRSILFVIWVREIHRDVREHLNTTCVDSLKGEPI